MADRIVTANDATGALPPIVQEKLATDVKSSGSTVGAAVGQRITMQVAADVASAVAGASTVQTAAASAAATAVATAVPPAVQAYLAAGNIGQFRYTGFAWYDGNAKTPDAFHALGPLGQDAGALTGNTGYARQTTGIPVDPQVQSRMRRCVLKNDGTGVAYYLDCDDSTKIAGSYAAGAQTGWVRVHEGVNDPVRPIPGQANTGSATLRAGVPDWSSTATYAKGNRVAYNGRLWDCLSDGNNGIVPTAGATASVLTGTDGQVMVEVPRFYYAETYDQSTGRVTYSVACDIAQMIPFPDLSTASTGATSIMAGGRVHNVHPAFTMGGVQRRARYIAAYRATASDTGNNTTGTLKSVADGSTVYAGTISRTNFRAKARNNNATLTDPSGQANNVWHLVDFNLWHAIQLLVFTEFRTFHSQAVLGGGNIGGSDYQKIAGRSNPLGNALGVYNASGVLQTPTTGDFDGVAYRGIEDLFGSQWIWVDGWNLQYTAGGVEHHTSNAPYQFADGTASNYTRIPGLSPLTAGSWAWPKSLLPGTFIPEKVGGSDATYLTDGYITANATSGWYAARVGATADFGSRAGAAALVVYHGASSANVDIGAALAR